MATDWAATGPSTTDWQAVTPGATVTNSLLTQVQNEAAAASLSADAAAAAAVSAAASAAAAAVSASSSATSATNAADSEANALTYANQALAAASGISGGGAELMPYLLGDGETYTIAAGRQGLFAAPVEFAGTGNMVVDGLLIEVA